MAAKISRREAIAAGLAASALPRASARADTWPSHTITLVHGFGAGGNADVVARLIAANLSTRIGQAVIVEPKPGAGGRIAAVHTAKAAADGYTLAILPGGHAIAPAIYDGLPYDTVNDFSFIGMATEFPFLLVTYADHAVKSLRDLLDKAATSAVPMTYGSAGNGTGQHMAGALFASMAGVKLQHVPFKGGAQGATDLLGKHIDFMFETPTLLLELVKSGQLRALAVTGSTRFFALPEVPAIAEAVPGYETTSWLGLAAPPKLPAEIVSRLNTELRAILADKTVEDRMRQLGNVPTATSPEAFKARVSSDVAKWTKIAEDAGIKRAVAQ